MKIKNSVFNIEFFSLFLHQSILHIRAANIRLQILQGEKSLVDGIVKVGEPIQRNLPIANKLPLRFIIDNNGNSDTDWLFLSIH